MRAGPPGTDFAGINKVALDNVRRLLADWLPAGVWQDEVFTAGALRFDAVGGDWTDGGDGVASHRRHGAGLVALYAKLQELGVDVAARAVAGMVGLESEVPDFIKKAAAAVGRVEKKGAARAKRKGKARGASNKRGGRQRRRAAG